MASSKMVTTKRDLRFDLTFDFSVSYVTLLPGLQEDGNKKHKVKRGYYSGPSRLGGIMQFSGVVPLRRGFG